MSGSRGLIPASPAFAGACDVLSKEEAVADNMALVPVAIGAPPLASLP